MIKPVNYIIGSIDFPDDILNEVKIADNKHSLNVRKLGKCSVEVYPGEGCDYPHFHVLNHDDLDLCVMIYDNMLFSHKSHPQVLTASWFCVKLDPWLSEKNFKYTSLTNWEVISNFWKEGNGASRCYDYLGKPSYLSLKEYDSDVYNEDITERIKNYESQLHRSK